MVSLPFVVCDLSLTFCRRVLFFVPDRGGGILLDNRAAVVALRFGSLSSTGITSNTSSASAALVFGGVADGTRGLSDAATSCTQSGIVRFGVGDGTCMGCRQPGQRVWTPALSSGAVSVFLQVGQTNRILMIDSTPRVRVQLRFEGHRSCYAKFTCSRTDTLAGRKRIKQMLATLASVAQCCRCGPLPPSRHFLPRPKSCRGGRSSERVLGRGTRPNRSLCRGRPFRCFQP